MYNTNPPFGIFLIVIAMMFNATKDSITKMLATSYTPLTILLIPFLSFYWVAPKMEDITILIGFTSLATIGQILMVGSFSFAAATIIAPFVYTQIIWATSVGFVLFGVLPNQWSWIGIVIVAVTGVYIAISEIKLKEG
jgi:drug/metabolite transporter (DMT)-like permease